MSNGNSKDRETPDKEEEGEDTGEEMLPGWDLWNNLKGVVSLKIYWRGKLWRKSQVLSWN